MKLASTLAVLLGFGPALALAQAAEPAPASPTAQRVGWAPRAHADASTNHVITIEAMQFAPPTLEVHVGDTVTWKNGDPFPHNVTAENGRFKSPDLAFGAKWTFKARRKGTFPYVCTLHPGMKAMLLVR